MQLLRVTWTRMRRRIPGVMPTTRAGAVRTIRTVRTVRTKTAGETTEAEITRGEAEETPEEAEAEEETTAEEEETETEETEEADAEDGEGAGIYHPPRMPVPKASLLHPCLLLLLPGGDLERAYLSRWAGDCLQILPTPAARHRRHLLRHHLLQAPSSRPTGAGVFHLRLRRPVRSSRPTGAGAGLRPCSSSCASRAGYTESSATGRSAIAWTRTTTCCSRRGTTDLLRRPLLAWERPCAPTTWCGPSSGTW